MEDIASKVEDFSSDEEIIGAYDAEWHKLETERVVRLADQELKEEIKELQKEYEQTKQEVEQSQKELEEQKQSYIEEGLKQTALNMLKENIDINFISKVTGLNIDQIKKLESK
jgi:uncharacterized protein YlxW (UPF0749 family)